VLTCVGWPKLDHAIEFRPQTETVFDLDPDAIRKREVVDDDPPALV
jgi:hypothetical protein